jgi:NAD(P)-dependent dehydrogenase (short-subunit alcohol dehydrogenase family)
MGTKRSVVVTGASTGIGWATVKLLVSKGFRVFGTVRKQSDADRLTAAFGNDVVPLLADVTDEQAVEKSAEQVGQMLGQERLAGLVNNAGIVVGGPLLHLQPDEIRHQMEVNLIGPFLVTKAFAPLLGSDSRRTGQPGRIVQISSVSGVMGFPYVGPYCASKFALEGMSESLRRELMIYGIDVIVVGPGAVVTPIWDKAAAQDYSRFDSTDFGPSIQKFLNFFGEEGKKGLAPEAIAQTIYQALTASKPKTRYAIVPQPFKNWTMPRILPKRFLDRFLAKQLGLQKVTS